MKWTWINLRISITGARLIHLVKKDKIWDHGSMIEQVKVVFNMVQRAKTSHDVESLKKICSVSGFQNIEQELYKMNAGKEYPECMAIKEVTIVEAKPGKKDKPDRFKALINTVTTDETKDGLAKHIFSVQWYFVRNGKWWVLDKIKK